MTYRIYRSSTSHKNPSGNVFIDTGYELSDVADDSSVWHYRSSRVSTMLQYRKYKCQQSRLTYLSLFYLTCHVKPIVKIHCAFVIILLVLLVSHNYIDIETVISLCSIKFNTLIKAIHDCTYCNMYNLRSSAAP